MVQETWVQSQVASYQSPLKMVLDISLLNTQQYKVSRLKWSNPGKGVALSPMPRCSNYWKGNLLVALDYGRQLSFFYIKAKID